MPSLYTFSEPSADWPSEFQREADRLRALLADELRRRSPHRQHLGPGLAAKPIIPVPAPLGPRHLACRRPHSRAPGSRLPRLGRIRPLRPPLLHPRLGDVRTHNLHVYQADDPAVDRHLSSPAPTSVATRTSATNTRPRSVESTPCTRRTSPLTTTARTPGLSAWSKSRWPGTARRGEVAPRGTFREERQPQSFRSSPVVKPIKASPLREGGGREADQGEPPSGGGRS